ncbi:MAG: hypothetical protein AB7G11_15520 [Phycisphaerales bacterium]
MKTRKMIVAAASLCLMALVAGCASDKKEASASSDKSMGAMADNTVCPYSKNPVNPSAGVVSAGGKNIGFCCTGCKAKFEALDAKAREQMAATVAK